MPFSGLNIEELGCLDLFLGAVTNVAVIVCKGNLEGTGCGAVGGYNRHLKSLST